MKTKHMLLTIFFVLLVPIAIHLYLLDGLDGAIWSAMFEEDTIYAPGYSDLGFRRVAEGMTESEVQKILGPPLDVGPCKGVHSHRWARSANDSHYRVRAIQFNGEKVAKKYAEFYVD